MAKLASKAKVRKQTIKDMQALGIYKPEYNRLIAIYAELCEQYDIIVKEFKDGNYSYEVDTPQGGSKKAPIVATLESLRKDILVYSDRLCLNPKAIETVTTGKTNRSKLAQVLSELK